jgi:hypothetical protein
MMTKKQYVNLSKDDIFKDSDIDSVDRCGTVTIKVEVDKADQAIAYKVKVTAKGSDNVTYTSAEEKRNPNFLMTKGKLSVADEKSVLLDGLQLPAAGGNQYRIEVMDANGKVVSSDVEIESRRKLYYQIISMKTGSHPSSFTGFTGEFDKYNIEMIEKDDGRNSMKFIKTVHNDNENEFYVEARKAYKIKRFQPYGVAVVFSNMVADYINNYNNEHIDLLVPSKLDTVHHSKKREIIVDLKDDYNEDAYLWEGLDDGHDAADKFWLISAFFVTVSGQRLQISRSKINKHGGPRFQNGGYNQVRIILDEEHLSSALSLNKGVIELATRVVKGFSGGFSVGNKNIITIARKSWWQSHPDSDIDSIQILNHEMGHKVGMATTGDKPFPSNKSHFSFIDKITPDSSDNLYGEYYEGPDENNYGHQGPHCKEGVNYAASTNSWSGGKPGCVMFGATGMTDTNDGIYKSSPTSFCSKCGKSVRKLDVDGNNRVGLKNQF